jgi:putative ABC transport system ATP-binding protein
MSLRALRRDSEGSPSPLYRLRSVVKDYGRDGTRVRAVDTTDLEVAAGEFVVIAGPSGSGKSTLLQLLGALDRPTGGAIEFDGTNLAGLGDGELGELRLREIGFIFQQFNLIPTLTAIENVEAALAPTTSAQADRRSRATGLLERVGLGARVGHLPSQLSGGEQQRVAIARALANEPRVLLADEPTGNLDATTGSEVMSLLRELSIERGQTIVLVTHDPGIAADAPTLLRMTDGRLTQSDETPGRTEVKAR